MNEKVKKIIEYGARAPHFHPNFPLILFWSQKSGCTSFANWFFSQIGLYEIAMQYNPSIHNYEYDIYKSKAGYIMKLSRELLRRKKYAKISTESLQKSGKLFCFSYCSTRYRKSRVGSH